MDGHPVHKSKKVRQLIESLERFLETIVLPPYAPNLNPDELVWNYMKSLGTREKSLKKSWTLITRATLDLEATKRSCKFVN